MEVFTQRNFAAHFIRLKLNFIYKTKTKIVFQPPFGGLRDNVRTPSIACWRARGRLPIRHNWTFRYLLRLKRYNGKLSKSSCFEGVGHLQCKFQTEGSAACQSLSMWENWNDCCGIKMFAVHCLVLSQSTRVTDIQTDVRTDGQTDGQSDRQYRATTHY